ncbi:phosphoglycan beta 1,3 galactosyltransferase [Leishmania tarentolae]|uniref:Phosphoglycan beta 1,3 galactosyltransferase n=1 Tax=Leishmania tarentolae TaxID=5689 RepID=A0A640K7P5_LEITA|nr:phosphoglycan beta 1,3 galactosyltransferase [Leishmania tarentolae]
MRPPHVRQGVPAYHRGPHREPLLCHPLCRRRRGDFLSTGPSLRPCQRGTKLLFEVAVQVMIISGGAAMRHDRGPRHSVQLATVQVVEACEALLHKPNAMARAHLPRTAQRPSNEKPHEDVFLVESSSAVRARQARVERHHCHLCHVHAPSLTLRLQNHLSEKSVHHERHARIKLRLLEETHAAPVHTLRCLHVHSGHAALPRIGSRRWRTCLGATHHVSHIAQELRHLQVRVVVALDNERNVREGVVGVRQPQDQLLAHPHLHGKAPLAVLAEPLVRCRPAVRHHVDPDSVAVRQRLLPQRRRRVADVPRRRRERGGHGERQGTAQVRQHRRLLVDSHAAADHLRAGCVLHGSDAPVAAEPHPVLHKALVGQAAGALGLRGPPQERIRGSLVLRRRRQQRTQALSGQPGSGRAALRGRGRRHGCLSDGLGLHRGEDVQRQQRRVEVVVRARNLLVRQPRLALRLTQGRTLRLIRRWDAHHGKVRCPRPRSPLTSVAHGRKPLAVHVPQPLPPRQLRASIHVVRHTRHRQQHRPHTAQRRRRRREHGVPWLQRNALHGAVVRLSVHAVRTVLRHDV